MSNSPFSRLMNSTGPIKLQGSIGATPTIDSWEGETKKLAEAVKDAEKARNDGIKNVFDFAKKRGKGAARIAPPNAVPPVLKGAAQNALQKSPTMSVGRTAEVSSRASRAMGAAKQVGSRSLSLVRSVAGRSAQFLKSPAGRTGLGLGAVVAAYGIANNKIEKAATGMQRQFGAEDLSRDAAAHTEAGLDRAMDKQMTQAIQSGDQKQQAEITGRFAATQEKRMSGGAEGLSAGQAHVAGQQKAAQWAQSLQKTANVKDVVNQQNQPRGQTEQPEAAASQNIPPEPDQVMTQQVTRDQKMGGREY